MSDFTVFGVLQHFASNLMSPRILLLYFLVEYEAPVFSRMKYCHCDFGPVCFCVSKALLTKFKIFLFFY